MAPEPVGKGQELRRDRIPELRNSGIRNYGDACLIPHFRRRRNPDLASIPQRRDARSTPRPTASPARRRRPSASTHALDEPSARRARFQNGARVLRKSISISAAAKASPRCAAATATMDDLLARLEPAEAMDDGDADQRPARLRFGDDARDLGLGHAGIMLDFERGQRAALVAAEADEGDQRADVAPPGGQRAASARRRNARPGRARRPCSASGHRREEGDFAGPGDARASWRAWVRSSAVRIASSCRSGLIALARAGSQAMSSAIVATSGGGAISSSHADALAHPGEIERFHRASRAPDMVDSGLHIVPSGVDRKEGGNTREARGRFASSREDLVAGRPGDEESERDHLEPVFHLATAVTGTGTLSSARYSRRPEDEDLAAKDDDRQGDRIEAR